METWKPHQQIKNGRFTIEKVIGGGGYGVTYRAIDQREKPDKLVVIKTLNRIQQEKPDFATQQEKFV
jgi:serine/threonine protein kinase